MSEYRFETLQLHAGQEEPDPDTRAVYLETLENPGSDIPDIEAVAELVHRHGIPPPNLSAA